MKFGKPDSHIGTDPAAPTDIPYGNHVAETPVYLDDPSQLSILPDGIYAPMHRPLARGYSVPGRGVQGHGVDSDVKTEDYLPIDDEQHPRDQLMEDTELIIAPSPLPVVIVPDVMRTVHRVTRVTIAIPHNAIYDASNAGAPATGLFAVDPTTVYEVLPHDETRVRATLVVQTYNAAGVDAYAFLVGTSRGDANGIIMDATINQIVIQGKNRVYVGVVPHANYSAGAVNKLRLSVIAEYESLLNDKR